MEGCEETETVEEEEEMEGRDEEEEGQERREEEQSCAGPVTEPAESSAGRELREGIEVGGGKDETSGAIEGSKDAPPEPEGAARLFSLSLENSKPGFDPQEAKLKEPYNFTPRDLLTLLR